MARKTQHVVPRGKKWAVRKGGSMRATREFDTQKEAIKAARKISKNQDAELVIHGKNGRIRESDSHGNDPYPPKG